jgi:plastocyanin
VTRVRVVASACLAAVALFGTACGSGGRAPDGGQARTPQIANHASTLAVGAGATATPAERMTTGQRGQSTPLPASKATAGAQGEPPIPGPPGAMAVSVVHITASGYSPARITVTRQTAVDMFNDATVPESWTSDDGYFDYTIQPGQKAELLFSVEGTYAFHDRMHQSWTGSILVSGDPPSVVRVTPYPTRRAASG